MASSRSSADARQRTGPKISSRAIVSRHHTPFLEGVISAHDDIVNPRDGGERHRCQRLAGPRIDDHSFVPSVGFNPFTADVVSDGSGTETASTAGSCILAVADEGSKATIKKMSQSVLPNLLSFVFAKHEQLAWSHRLRTVPSEATRTDIDGHVKPPTGGHVNDRSNRCPKHDDHA